MKSAGELAFQLRHRSDDNRIATNRVGRLSVLTGVVNSFLKKAKAFIMLGKIHVVVGNDFDRSRFGLWANRKIDGSIDLDWVTRHERIPIRARADRRTFNK